jgi:hypothetical protein
MKLQRGECASVQQAENTVLNFARDCVTSQAPRRHY